MGTTLDLDNLVPEPAELTIGGTKLQLNPPTLRSLFVINKFATELQKGENAIIEPEKLEADLKAELDRLCPGLDKFNLSGSQILAVANLVAEMSVPKKQKQATAGGTVTADPKTDTDTATP